MFAVTGSFTQVVFNAILPLLQKIAALIASKIRDIKSPEQNKLNMFRRYKKTR